LQRSLSVQGKKKRENLLNTKIQMSDADQNGRDKSSTQARETRKKTPRELWEEEEALRKASGPPHVTLEMGSKPMCNVGGCGYFSDEDK
jgi:hypothetical protein